MERGPSLKITQQCSHSFVSSGCAAEIRRETTLMRIWMILFGILVFGTMTIAAEDPVYRAEHLMQCASWHAVFYKTGFGHETFQNTCGDQPRSYDKLHRLSSDQLQKIQKALTRSRFEELPKS